MNKKAIKGFFKLLGHADFRCHQELCRGTIFWKLPVLFKGLGI